MTTTKTKLEFVQNAYTIKRYLRAVGRRAADTDFSSLPEDAALETLHLWLAEPRTLAAFDAWIDGKKASQS